LIDIEPKHLELLKSILSDQIPTYTVWAFGSRVSGKAKRYSDLDIAIISSSPLPPGSIGKLRDSLSESDLPFKVDIVDWATTSSSFRKIIESPHEVIQTKKEDTPLPSY